MKFFEDGDFLDDFDDEDIDIYICNECGSSFEVVEGNEPDTCPNCGIEFLPEGTC